MELIQVFSELSLLLRSLGIQSMLSLFRLHIYKQSLQHPPFLMERVN